MRRVLTAAALMLLTSSALQAADLRMATKAPPPIAYAPVANWSGFYIGAVGGWARGNAFSNHPDGGLIGGTVGFNYQPVGSAFVFGIEGDWSWAEIEGAYAFGTSRIESVGTLRGRLGWAAGPVLVYGTGGFAFANNRINDVFFGSDRQDHVGYAVGAGLEWMMAPAWSVKAEYLYMDFDRERYFGGAFSSGGHISAIRLGLNYRFSGFMNY